MLVEESVRGWDEFELEVIRDKRDNVVIVCSIENLDPMGVHTGDSVTVAPQMTLSDEAYQELRDAAAAIVRAVGVECGGSNIQFARSRETGELRVIEMNPRVSRSSALASKATGYPIAKVAAKLAVGYTLDEIPNDLTGTTPASFEPTLDYVVVKVPRFAFEKFPGADTTLGTQMKSVGEAMGIGRTFSEAFCKALRSRELDAGAVTPWATSPTCPTTCTPGSARAGRDPRRAARGALARRPRRRRLAAAQAARPLRPRDRDAVRRRRVGGADAAALVGGQARVPARRLLRRRGRGELELPLLDLGRGRRAAARAWSVVILGSGPNRIGQGIEFDYCCVHAARSFRALGREAVMVNCNPETVSTDYDTSDRLYFEPLGEEEVLAICEREQPEGVVIQFGGQTPLKLARALEEAGYRILGTPFDAVDLAEDRERFGALCAELGIRCPEWGTAAGADEAVAVAERIGYPVLVRPSYVLGGRAMRVCYDEEAVRSAMRGTGARVLVDRFLEQAVEVDVDALCDGDGTWVAAVMEHVEEAGVHSGDSSCVLPPQSLGPDAHALVCAIVERLAPALGVIGLVNVQLAVTEDGEVYVLEANPRASRTVPFASKAIGVNLVEAACRLMAGARLAELDLPLDPTPAEVSVKAAVLPFGRFPGSDPVLGPEMRSTGEVMASARDFASAFAKAERAAGRPLPAGGVAFLSVRDGDKEFALPIAQALSELGFDLLATAGTARAVAAAGLSVQGVAKGAAIVELIRRGRCDLVVNTPEGGNARRDGYLIREAALAPRVPVHHDDPGRGGRGERDRERAGRDRALAPGAA